jgi:hypothetical protein
MTKEETRSRAAVVRAMYETAKQNGKNPDFIEIYDTATRLHRLEVTLGRLACDACNYPTYDEAKQARLEMLAERIIADKIGAKCYTQRDPRGYCIRMYLQDETGRRFANSWDGETAALAW